jgi:hypothetical protein
MDATVILPGPFQKFSQHFSGNHCRVKLCDFGRSEKAHLRLKMAKWHLAKVTT